jgi:four helix bundle protein
MAQIYRDLKVWQKAVSLVTELYRVTQDFPPQETYGLTSQIRRAAISIPSNIAEGHGRRTRKDYHHFVIQARGSLLELETQIIISQNLKYLKAESSAALLNQTSEIGRMLNGLLKSLTAEP